MTIALWGFLLICSLLYFLIYKKRFSQYFLFIAVIFAIILLCSCIQYLFISNSSFSTRALRSLITAFLILSIGAMTSSLFESEKQVANILRVFSYTCVAMGIYVFFKFLINSNVTGRLYAYQDGKNEISILFFAASLYFLFREKKSKLNLVFDFGLFAFFVLVIFYLRCRSALAGYLVPVMFIMISRDKKINRYRIPMIIMVVVVGVLIAAVPAIRDYFFKSLISNGKETADLETFGTGRFYEINVGMNLLAKNPLFGVGRQKVEMFLMSILVQYGIIFALPIFIFATMPIYPAFKYDFDEISFTNQICVILGFSFFFMGIFEELMPIGPGVRTYILWFLVGVNYFKSNTRLTLKHTLQFES